MAVPDESAVSFVVSPSCPAEHAFSDLRVLRARFPALSGHHFDALCTTLASRAEAMASVAGAADLMVIGARDTEDVSVRALTRALRFGGPVRVLTCAEQLDVADLADVTTVGLACTPGAPTELTAGLIRSLSGLGPLTAWRRSVRTEGEYGVLAAEAEGLSQRQLDPLPA